MHTVTIHAMLEFVYVATKVRIQLTEQRNPRAFVYFHICCNMYCTLRDKTRPVIYKTVKADRRRCLSYQER